MIHKPARMTLLGGLALSALILCAPASAKDFYKWKDDNGVTHYSAHPPKDKSAQTVRATNITGEAPTTPASKPNNAESSAPKEAAPAEEIAQKPIKDPEICKSARKNLKTLKENGRVKVQDGDSYRYLGEKEHQDKIKEMNKLIKTNC